MPSPTNLQQQIAARAANSPRTAARFAAES
eukprot:COSAG04_NODE_15509_length_530_cov_0.700696_1_plen_29_part_10